MFTGKTFSFAVNLNSVGCNCNAALYTVGMPGKDASGAWAVSTTGDYYADANQVSGVWGPEMDHLEGNNRWVGRVRAKSDNWHELQCGWRVGACRHATCQGPRHPPSPPPTPLR